jgi:hypothetical protein
MPADICDPSDEKAVERFRESLHRLGAHLKKTCADSMGVDLYDLTIGEQELMVFSDAWSLDIEGPDDLVRRVLEE